MEKTFTKMVLRAGKKLNLVLAVALALLGGLVWSFAKAEARNCLEDQILPAYEARFQEVQRHLHNEGEGIVPELVDIAFDRESLIIATMRQMTHWITGETDVHRKQKVRLCAVWALGQFPNSGEALDALGLLLLDPAMSVTAGHELVHFDSRKLRYVLEAIEAKDRKCVWGAIGATYNFKNPPASLVSKLQFLCDPRNTNDHSLSGHAVFVFDSIAEWKDKKELLLELASRSVLPGCEFALRKLENPFWQGDIDAIAVVEKSIAHPDEAMRVIGKGILVDAYYYADSDQVALKAKEILEANAMGAELKKVRSITRGAVAVPKGFRFGENVESR